MTRRVLISIGILATISCILLSCIVMFGFLRFGLLNKNQAYAKTPTPLLSDPLPPNPVGFENLPADIMGQMNDIQAQVIQIRGLVPLRPVQRNILSPVDLREKVEEDFLADYPPEDAADDVFFLNALGLLESGYDLHKLYLDMYSEQVAGYYDTETKEMFIVQGTSFGVAERMTYAHEYTHALQDQHYDLEKGLKINPDFCETNNEYCVAATSLVEGDAVLTEQTWFSRFSTDVDKQQLQDFMNEFKSPVFDSAPLFLQEDFLFPYQQGMEFAASLFDIQGQETIDRAFANPPITTEQILHPDHYPIDNPTRVVLPLLTEILGDQWRVIDQNSLGEWFTYLILVNGWREETRLPIDKARDAVSGWNGDNYIFLQNQETGAIIFTLVSAWETENDAQEYWDTFSRYGLARWGSAPNVKKADRLEWNAKSDGYIILFQTDKKTYWVIAPDQITAESILSKFF